ncbi:glycosyltransferase family 2 protein [Falsirhodobacter sp. 20TX0035]|uniref:glycosyltransferase family 2 protein n=1 Tax=Falsirhodobacter sp. 20TX0035 TaxID=3022019 RepID=UPI00232DEE99|nr:glycosyltransferase family 2 protein [Falsirhodobacter sp. 20TX0035]MDB6454795.1 glycosyltransferase family 2 protein [Falsirhodobacter sp. 20TX0035]
MTPSLLIVIPTLNEAKHIAQVLASVLAFPAARDARIVVADGGSTDGTPDIVRRIAGTEPRVHLMHNPQRLQSAAVNRAVEEFGADHEWLLRLDAHSAYPADFADVVLHEAQQQGADSVVVSMVAEGEGFWQQAVALAQNSRLGNGGSAHRLDGPGKWVDHGHHALMRMAAFRAAGGYDPGFSHNEDAELDHRLRAAGFRIWLTQRTRLTYFPRRTVASLWRQYQNFGRGRRRNLTKHGMRPATRQAVVAALAPALACAVLAPLNAIFALPLLLWIAGCLAGGVAIALSERHVAGLFAGFFAGIMHLAWSVGYWREWISARPKQERVRHA